MKTESLCVFCVCENHTNILSMEFLFLLFMLNLIWQLLLNSLLRLKKIYFLAHLIFASKPVALSLQNWFRAKHKRLLPRRKGKLATNQCKNAEWNCTFVGIKRYFYTINEKKQVILDFLKKSSHVISLISWVLIYKFYKN